MLLAALPPEPRQTTLLATSPMRRNHSTSSPCRKAPRSPRPSAKPSPAIRITGVILSRPASPGPSRWTERSEEHTSELQSRLHLVCRLLLEKKKNETTTTAPITYRTLGSVTHNG